MNRNKKNLILIGLLILALVIGGIAFLIFSNNDNEYVSNNRNNGTTTSILDNYDSDYEQDDEFSNGDIPNVEIKFGNNSKTFTAVMENNQTAIQLVRNITGSGRNLPIYNYDNFEGYEYFQYYDVPSSYKIPSNPTQVTSEKAGEIYYSSPNRVIIFYQDANITGNYTKIGQIEDVNGLKKAVEDNPVLQGWGNKLVLINYDR